MHRSKGVPVIVAMLSLVLSSVGFSQVRHIGVRPFAPNVIVPQSRHSAFTPDRHGTVGIKKVDVLIDIVEATATTTIEIQLTNETSHRQEAELIIPVPDGAVVRGFAYDGPCHEITAQVLPKEEARRIYQDLVARIRDPALVEFIGYNLIRSSVFPIEARSRQKVRLTYEHLLEVDGDRVDYVLPRSESLQYAVPWTITARIRAERPVSTVYSASHRLEMERLSERELSVKIAVDACQPGPFRLSYLRQKNGVTASLFAYPDRKVGGGYFLLLAGLPARISDEPHMVSLKREVTLVIDRSGSMRNEKIEQVKEAALQIVAGLRAGEAFNIIIYSNTVEWFSPGPVLKDEQTEKAARRYIEGLTAAGGTNIYDALDAALRQEPVAGMLPIVLFLTDGLPTVGQTAEVAIRELAVKANPHRRRVFTFGVGFDVNAPLLEKIAGESRGRAEFVLPQEDVEVKVGRVFSQLTGPVLADPKLRILGSDEGVAVGRTRDILPQKLPDFFEGDHLVLLGQYIGTDALVFEIKGNYFGKERTFTFTFDFDKATPKNGFVPRLWASRKIAELIDTIRQTGADPTAAANDPKMKELVDEIVRLSTEFGILTEYTAFLAREGTNLHDRVEVRRETWDNLYNRAVSSRSGIGAVNQSFNFTRQKDQEELNPRNGYYDENLNAVVVNSVQQINDSAYYRRGSQWVDSRLVAQHTAPAKVIEFGSREFFELADRLARESRQGSIALGGDVLLMVDGEPVLIQSPSKN